LTKKLVILHKSLVFNFVKASFTKYQDFCLFWGYVWMYSWRHVVNIDFQLLGLESDCKEGGILGTEILYFQNINHLLHPISSKIEVFMNWMPPGDVLFIGAKISVQYICT
jgi:hypothetical protein